jgi:hypothetical protein
VSVIGCDALVAVHELGPGRLVLRSNFLTQSIDKALANLLEPPRFILWDETLGRQYCVCKLIGSKGLRGRYSLGVSGWNAEAPIGAKLVQQVGQVVFQR